MSGADLRERSEGAPLVHYRLDLDKTYLATPLERRLAMLKLPFEGAEAKRTLPGMAALVQALADERGPAAPRAHLTFLSASPTFMESTLRRKLELDGVRVDELVLKDQVGLALRRRFREIANPYAYKLSALLTLGATLDPATRGDSEVLIGDDWDLDPVIYTVYAAVRDGSLPDGIWEALAERNPTDPELQASMDELRAQVSGRSSVTRILIRREMRRGREFYGAFGSRLTTYDDAFQLALLLYDAELIAAAGVRSVIAALRERRWRQTAFRFSWESLRDEQHLGRYDAIRRLLEAEGLVPPRPFLRRILGRSPRPEPADRPPDWDRVVAAASPG